MTITEIIGDNIRGFRSQRKMTQATLGAKCNTTGNYIGEIERAETRITVEKLVEIAKVLKVQAFVFFIDGAYRKTPEELEKALRMK